MLMVDKNSSNDNELNGLDKSRGFGFVIMEHSEAVDLIIN